MSIVQCMLKLAALLFTFCLIEVAPVRSYSVPYLKFGPTFRNATLMQSINETHYGGMLPSVNFSLPVIKVAGSLSYSGATSAQSIILQKAIPFYVDMINAQGGIVMQGKRHLLQIVVADDQSSATLMQLVYSELLADPSITALITPQFDSLQQLLYPVISTSGRFWFNVAVGSPNSFPMPHYPYMMTALNSKDQLGTKSLDFIRDGARLYHQRVSGKSTYDSSTLTSPYGFVTVCAYSEPDDFSLAVYSGLMAWIMNENQRRATLGAGPEDLVRVVFNQTWPTVSDSIFALGLVQCADNTDVLFVSSAITRGSCTALTLAMAVTKLRPRAAWSSCGFAGYDANDSEMSQSWAGWMTFGNPLPRPSTLPVSVFGTMDNMIAVWKSYFGSVPTTSTQTVYVGAFDILTSIFNASTSTSSIDLRNAALALSTHNYNGFTGRNLSLDPVTGLNLGSMSYLCQLDQRGVITVDSSQLIYPYNWPWTEVEVGDEINTEFEVVAFLVGTVLSVLGCWVGVIVVEQAVFVRRRRGLYQLWLAVVAASIGGAGIWCSLLMQSAGFSTRIPGASQPQVISFSLPIALLALLPSLTLTFIGLHVMICDITVNDITEVSKSQAYVVRQQQRQEAEVKRKKAALSHKVHFMHLVESMSLRVVIGWICVAAGIVLTRVTMFNVWVHQAAGYQSMTGWIVSLIGHVALTLPAVLILFHGVRWRFVTVFLLAGAILIDWWSNILTMKVTLTANRQSNPMSLYDVLNISEMAMQLISGIAAMILCFVFIGLQFSRMQLSRNGLAVLVTSMENLISKQKEALKTEQQTNMVLQTQADQLVRIIECISLLSPVPKQYAYAMAMNATTSTIREIHDSKSAASTNHFKHPSGKQILAISDEVAHDQDAEKISIQKDHKVNQSSESVWRSRSLSASIVPLDAQEHATNVYQVTTANKSRRTSNMFQRSVLSPIPDDDVISQVHQPIISNNAPEHSEVGSKGSLNMSVNIMHVDHGRRKKQSEANCLSMIAAQRKSALVNKEINGFAAGVDFSFGSLISHSPGDFLPRPTLQQLLQHPVCLEIIKSELERIHCIENALFVVHASRYRRIENTQLRSVVARQIYATFIQENSEMQININTRQREAIAATVNQKTLACPTTLFCDTEHEVLQLMDTNLMKSFTQSTAYKLCLCVYNTINMQIVFFGETNDQTMMSQPQNEVSSAAEHTIVQSSITTDQRVTGD